MTASAIAAKGFITLPYLVLADSEQHRVSEQATLDVLVRRDSVAASSAPGCGHVILPHRRGGRTSGADIFRSEVFLERR